MNIDQIFAVVGMVLFAWGVLYLVSRELKKRELRAFLQLIKPTIEATAEWWGDQLADCDVDTHRISRFVLSMERVMIARVTDIFLNKCTDPITCVFGFMYGDEYKNSNGCRVILDILKRADIASTVLRNKQLQTYADRVKLDALTQKIEVFYNDGGEDHVCLEYFTIVDINFDR